MHYLLIHGGGSTSGFWDRVVPLLDRPAVAVDLPGRNGKPGDLTTMTVADEVAGALADLDAAEGVTGPVTVVAHSSGGLVVPGVVAGLRARGLDVDRIVLNAALVPLDGQGGLDCMKPHHREGLVWAVTEAERAGGPAITLPAVEDPESLREAYGGDPLSDDDLAFAFATTVADAVSHYFDPVVWSEVGDVPVTYVLCERDRPVATANQEVMAQRVPNLVDVVRLDTNHVPAITHPDLLAAAIVGASAG